MATESKKESHPLRSMVMLMVNEYYDIVIKTVAPLLEKKQKAFQKSWDPTAGVSKFPSRHHIGTVEPCDDLRANEALMWLVPTHMMTHIISVTGVSLILLASFLYALVHDSCSEVLTLMFGVVLVVWVQRRVLPTLDVLGKPWMDPTSPAKNRLDMHVPLRFLESTKNARRTACSPKLVSRENVDDDSYTPNVLLLDPMDWKFQLFQTVESALTFMMHETTVLEGSQKDDKAWKSIQVPGNWMLQGFADIPIYTNIKYPFPCIPPIVPRKNPTGVYKLKVPIPSDWCTTDESGSDDDEWTLLLHGVESACFVFWNGELLGHFKDSRLPSEFSIPSKLREQAMSGQKEAVLHLVVVRWSDGSYVEDQDHWWMAGIHRSVELIRRPSKADILDYHVLAADSGELSVSVRMRDSSLETRVLQAFLFNDEQLTADGEWKARAEIWSEKKTLTATGSSMIQFQTKLQNIKQWTAETPNLYTLVLEQSTPEGATTQTESCRVGFRTIKIEGGVLKLNGKRITICGMNRHEHDPDHGKVVSLDRMKQDITTLKQNNFNAIRTSHYPTHSSFYRFCDFYGMYVCDEANIETHGMKPMGRLAHDWGWEKTFVSRVRRLVQRDWNHASIITWSLGNEAGRGRNLLKARQAILDVDTSRPIQYESGGAFAEGIGRTELTDLICPMYPDVERTVALGKREDEDRPVILCEYSHSMGNSNGNLHLYWKNFWDEKTPRLQGGYIWDMIDQGLRVTAKNGREHFAYGGDFGDVINDRQFCINGMFSPEREPHPVVSEIKYLQQPAEIVPIDDVDVVTFSISARDSSPIALLVGGQKEVKLAPISLMVQNRYVFQDLSNLKWTWCLYSDRMRDPVLEGDAMLEKDLLVFDTEPRRNIGDLDGLRDEKNKSSCFLTIEGKLNKDHSWAKNNHVIITKQLAANLVFEDGWINPEESISRSLEINPLKVLSDETTIQISCEDNSPFVVIEKRTGCITSLVSEGENLLCGNGVKTNLTRATTDNDRGGKELDLEFKKLAWAAPLYPTEIMSHEFNWKQLGFSQAEPPEIECTSVTVKEELSDRVHVVVESVVLDRQKKVLAQQQTEYWILLGGKVKVTNRFIPQTLIQDIPSLPRVGLCFQLNPAFFNVSYFGRGPFENYEDRKSGATMRLWETTPSQMGYDYIVPSENGNRSDCEWISFESGNGGLLIFGDSSSFNFSALLHSADETNNALHTSDLDVRKDGTHPIYVNVDHKLMGLGGDVSWAPCVYPEYLVKAQVYEYSLVFVPLSKDEKPEEVSKSFP